MNVVQDMLFQQMQMLAAGMSPPQTGGSDGKTNFQSVMDQTRGESQAVKEPEKQLAAAQKIYALELSVRQAELMCRSMSAICPASSSSLVSSCCLALIF